MAGAFGEVTPVQNTLMDLAQPYLQAQQYQQGQEALRGLQMQNDYTAAVQPGQINLLNQSMNGLTGSAAPAAPPNALSGAPVPAAVGQGGTPMSGGFSLADAVHQNESRGSMQPGIMGDGGQAAGPMQVHPEALADVNTRLGTNYTHAQLAAQPDVGMKVGQTYLNMMQEQFGRPDYALGAYNAGPGAMRNAIASGQGIAGLSPGAQAYVAHGMSAMHGAGHSDTLAGMMNGAPAPSAGVQVASNDPTSGIQPAAQPGAFQPPPGAQPVPQDDAARASVRRLVMMQQMALAEPKGAGMRAAGQFQQALDQIAGPGGVVEPRTGNVYRVPGSYDTRFAAANAAEAGKVAPSAQLFAQNDAVKEASTQATHAANTAVDVNADRAKILKVAPGENVTTGITAGVGAPATAASLQTGAAATMPQPGQGGTYQGVATPSVAAATKEGDQSVAMQEPIMTQAKESQNALNRIGQVRAALQQATTNGLPPGYFSPALAEGAAAAKSLGIDLSSLGIDPKAIQSQQVANEALTQINGEILKRMFPQRITNADVTTFGKNLAQYGMDPAALDPILNQAQQSAQYDVDKAHDMLAYKGKNNNNTVGWDTQFYQKHGFGPDMLNAVKAGTVPPPGGTAANAPPARAPAPSTPSAAPAAPSLPMVQQEGRMVPDNTKLSHDQVYRLPDGRNARFDGKRMGFVPVP